MQRQNSQDLTNFLLNESIASTGVGAMNDNSNSNDHFQSSRGGLKEEEIDLEASLSRIDRLSDSLNALTRKRPVVVVDAAATSNHNNNNPRGKFSKRRDSWSSCASSIGGHSFGIDDLVHNLEGLEFDLSHTNTNDVVSQQQQQQRLFLEQDNSSSTWNDSVSSRLSTGLWSLQDVEAWSCVTCTYENEPIFLACEMCGQCRPPVRTSVAVAAVGHGHAAAAVDESVLARQEQRLLEIQQFRSKPTEVLLNVPKPRRGNNNHARRGRTNNNNSTHSPKRLGGTRLRSPTRQRPSLASLGHSSLSLSGHSSLSLSAHGYGSRESSVRDLFADSTGSLHKPRRLDMQDSAATAKTFEMSMSSSSMDFFAPLSSEPRIVYPGIQEVDEHFDSNGSPEPSYPRSAEC